MFDETDADRKMVSQVKDKAEARLLRIPGVTGVGVGYKIVGDHPTSTMAIRVYVKHKRDVPEQEMIPREINGIPTDVIERHFILHPHGTVDAEEDRAEEDQSTKIGGGT